LRYSIRTPSGNSTQWAVLNDRGVAVFSGHYQQCEEWLDLRDAESRRLPKRSAGYAIAFARMMTWLGASLRPLVGG
jgi:hypothetical protein